MRVTRSNTAFTAAATLSLLLMGNGLATADYVDLDQGNANSMSVAEGSSGSFDVRLVAQDAPAGGDVVAGCNASVAKPITVTLASGASWASLNESTLEFTDCISSQTVTVSVTGSPATESAGAQTTINGVGEGGISATVEVKDKDTKTVTVTTVTPGAKEGFMNLNVPRLAHSAPVNAAPTVSDPAENVNGVEGDTLAANGQFADDAGAAGLTITHVSGDGTVTPSTSTPGAWSWSLPTTDNGSGTVVVRATDTQGLTIEDSFDWSAANAAPVVGSVSLTRTGACAVELSAAFSDVGTADTHTTGILWGDEAAGTEASLVSDTSPVTGSHTYASAGAYTATVYVKDDDSDTGTGSASSFSAYNSPSGILAPINTSNGARSSFKIGSTIPVKITVTGCNGRPAEGLYPQVNLAMGDTTPDFPVNEIVYSDSATNGKLMRWDSSGQQYIYNLSTKLSQFTGGALTGGTYTVAVNDPSFATPVKAVLFDLRK